MIAIDLTPTPHVVTRRRVSRIRAWAFGLIVYTLGISAGAAALAPSHQSVSRAMESELAMVRAKNTEAEQRVAEARVAMRRVIEALESNRAVGVQPDWSGLVRLVVGEMEEDLSLTVCELMPVEREVDDRAARTGREKQPAARVLEAMHLELSGVSRTQTAISDFMLRLEECGMFDRVEMVGTRRDERGASGALIAFEVRCVMTSRRP